MKLLRSVELEMARGANSWCKNVSRSRAGKCQLAAFRGQKAVLFNGIQMVQGWNISHHPVGRARCAAILLGIEFQIEIQQTRNYCQASSSLLRNSTSTHHVTYRLYNFACPQTAVKCEHKIAIVLCQFILVFHRKKGNFYWGGDGSNVAHHIFTLAVCIGWTSQILEYGWPRIGAGWGG